MKFLTTFMALAVCAGAAVFAQDTTPPQIVSTASLDRTSVGVLFNEALDPSVAIDATKYSIGGGASVDGAELLQDRKTVRLTVSGLTGSSYNLTVTGITDFSGNAVTASVTGQVLDFVAQDLGDAAPGVAAAIAPGSVDVYARGRDIWGFADSGHFVWKEKTGDFDVRVRLESFRAPAESANAGLMARETGAEGSRNISVVTYANQRVWVGTERAETDGISRVLAGNWSINWPTNAAYPNIWLRLKRTGDTFTTYGSTNGLDWVQVGDSVATPYPATLRVGMRTTPVEVQAPDSTGIAKYREYGDYAITSGTINIVEQPANATIRENTTATFSVRADVTGAPASNLSYQWRKDGVDIPGATSAAYTTPPVGLAANDSKYTVRLSLPGGAITKVSNEATLSVVQDNTPPKIVSLASLDGQTIGIRFDELLSATTAADPTKYALAAGSVDNASLGADGMTVTLNVSGLSGTTFSLTVNGVTDLVGNAVNITTNGQVLGFTASDVGTMIPPAAGTAISTAPGSVDVTARGLDIWGAADSGQFIWKEQTGDFDVRVRVESFQAPAFDANAGLMARESIEPGSRNVSVVVYANQKNWTATQRAETDGASSVLAGNWRINWPDGAAYPNVWVRLKRAGNTFTTYGSTNGVDWTQIGDAVTPANPYPQTLLLGLRTTPVEVEKPDSTALAKYRDYGPFAITGASINITAQPTSVAVLEHRSATFTAGAEAVGTASNNLTFQWQRDGVDIDGAISPTFTVSNATSADNGAKYRLKVSLPGVEPVFSQEATLTVNEDLVAPKIVSGGGLGSAIALVFDEDLDATSANDPAKYTVTGANVSAAELQPDLRTVVLTLDAVPSANFTVNVAGVGDLENNGATTTFNGQLSNMTFSDIGTVPEPSRGFSTNANSYTVYARGTDIWGFADSGNFIWEERTGDFDVKVQLASYVAPAASANAGLMARESLSEDSRNVQIVTYANQSQWVTAERPETGGNSRVTAGNWAIAWPQGALYPNIWMRLKRVGNTFTMYGGTNGVDWIQVGDAVTPETPFPDTALVGMRTTPVEVEKPGTVGIANYQNYSDVEISTAPSLNLQVADNQVTISWPTAAGAGFTLESASAVTGPWAPVTAAPVIDGANTKVTVAVDASGSQFFRLKR